MKTKIQQNKKTNIAKTNSTSHKKQNSPPPSSAKSLIERIMFLQRTIGNRAVQRLIQSKAFETMVQTGMPSFISKPKVNQVLRKEALQTQGLCPECEKDEIQSKPLDKQTLPKIQAEEEERLPEEDEPVCGVQEKLTMGSPGDVYEQEANRVAEEISSEVNLSDFSTMTSVQEKLLSSIDPHALGGLTERSIRPVISTDFVSSRKLSVNRKQGLPLHKDGSVPADIEKRIFQSKGNGSRLSPQMNAYMSMQTGYDFSSVRVKSDSEAADLNRSLGARAFANGSDIWLGRGEKATDVKLMAHELTHVAQQGAAKRIQPQSNAFSQLVASKGYMPKFMQALTKNVNGNSSLFQKGILQFINKYPSSQMKTLQAQILDGATKNDSINRRESAQTLRGSIGGCTPSSPSPSCCCCVDSINIKNVKKIDTAAHMGHQFKTFFKLSYKKKSGLKSNSSCSLEWWEKTNVPYTPSQKKNVWSDMTKDPQTSASFAASWNARKEPCPGTETVVDTDPPSLGKRPGRTVTRKLEFKIIAKSGPGCTCKNNSVTQKAEQVLTMVNAKPIWGLSTFRIL